MKTVYSNSEEVIHLFSNNIDHNIVNSSRNNSVYVSSTKLELYSYNTCIAIYDKIKNIMLISSETYSVTTSKQQGILNFASNHHNRIFIPNVNYGIESNLTEFKGQIKFNIKKESKARSKRMISNYRSSSISLLDNLQNYIKYLKLDLRTYGKYLKVDLNYNDLVNFFNDDLIRDKKLRDKELREKKKKRKLDQIKFNNDKKEFIIEYDLNGRNYADRLYKLMPVLFHHNKNELLFRFKRILSRIRSELQYFGIDATKYPNRDYLKVTNNDNIVSTQKVIISKKESILFYKLFKNKELKIHDRILDHYRIKSINEDSITIGCHTIDFSEIQYIAQRLELC